MPSLIQLPDLKKAIFEAHQKLPPKPKAPPPKSVLVRISAIVTACFRFSVTGKALVFEGSVIVV